MTINLFDPNYDDEPDEPEPLDAFITPEVGKEILRAREQRRQRVAERAERRRLTAGTSGVVAQNIRAEELGVVGILNEDEWSEWAGCFGGSCAYCGEPDVALCVEHVVPLARGGENTILNVVPACADCNMGKGPKEPLRWLLRTNRLDGFILRVSEALKKKTPTV